MDSLYKLGMLLVYRSLVMACASSLAIMGAIIFSALFRIPSRPGAFPFRNFWMTSLTLSSVTSVGMCMVSVYYWLWLISLRSASLSPGKNLSANI